MKLTVFFSRKGGHYLIQTFDNYPPHFKRFFETITTLPLRVFFEIMIWWIYYENVILIVIAFINWFNKNTPIIQCISIGSSLLVKNYDRSVFYISKWFSGDMITSDSLLRWLFPGVAATLAAVPVDCARPSIDVRPLRTFNSYIHT